MAYRPLSLNPQTPPRVKALITSMEDHYFRDVHTLLRLPYFEHDLPVGCNITITQILAAVVSGISVTLYDPTGAGAGARFKGLLTNFYPWSLEPGNAVTPAQGAEAVYNLFRNPLTHDLGLDIENKRKTQKLTVNRVVSPNGNGLPDQIIEQIEAGDRLAIPPPTITIAPGDTVLLVESFYWGVRKMIEDLSQDATRMQTAETFLASL